jgi:hypothetical protein
MVEPRPGDAPPRVVLRLSIDANHARWPKPPALGIVVGVFGGMSVAGGLGADAAATCPAACSKTPHSLGPMAGARVGLRFRNGLAVELTGGYLRMESSFSRAIPSSWTDAGVHTLVYAFEDDLLLRGPFFGAGASLRHPARGRVALVARTTVGAWIVTATDPITGTATSGGATAPVGVISPNERLTSIAPLVMTELGFDAKLGPFHVGPSLALAFVPADGPSFQHSQIEGVPNTCPTPTAVGCAPNSAAVANERAYGHFVLFVPELTATVAF